MNSTEKIRKRELTEGILVLRDIYVQDNAAADNKGSSCGTMLLSMIIYSVLYQLHNKTVTS